MTFAQPYHVVVWENGNKECRSKRIPNGQDALRLAREVAAVGPWLRNVRVEIETATVTPIRLVWEGRQ